MNMEQPSVRGGSEGGTQEDRIPLLRGVMWFRFCIGVPVCLLAVCLLLGGLSLDPAWSGLLLGVGFGFALVGVPSLVIAIGLWRRRLWAAYLALILDVIVVAALVIMMAADLGTFMVKGERLENVREAMGLGAVPVLVVVLEAAFLLRTVWRWRHTWPALGVLAAGLVLLGWVGPAAVNGRLTAHTRPLLAYVDTHRARIPPDASISVEAESGIRGRHTDRVDVKTDFVSWWIAVEHGKDGRWHFPVGDRALAGDPQCGDRSLNIESAVAARKLLRDCRVVDRNLVTMPVRPEYGSFPYAFWSPMVRGTYRVGREGTIELYLKEPLDVGQAHVGG